MVMRTSKKIGARTTILATTLLAAWIPAHAQETQDAAAKPDAASISLGAGLLSGDRNSRSLFSQYNGLRKHDSVLLLDFDYIRRNEETGTWTTARGRNLGLDTRELGFGMQRQGVWSLSADYNEIVRNDPRVANTALSGAGTTTPTITRLAAPGTGSELTFQTKREILGLSGYAWINDRFQFEASFKNEDKDGTRRWGRGYDCATAVCPRTGVNAQSATVQTWALLMLPEPINSNTKQAEAKLNFHTDKLFVTAGYYGSFYTNDNGSLTPSVPAALNGPTLANQTSAAVPLVTTGQGLRNVLQLPMALPPDNQAHQFYLSGNYAFTPKVRSTFKLAYTHATQNENFGGMGLTGAPAGRSDLGGVLNSTLAQFGVTARPMPKLSLLGNVRYEKKDDQTPLAAYTAESGQIRPSPWNNTRIGNTKLGGKAEASYLLPANVRGTVGVDYEQIKRELPPDNVFVAGISGLRGKTEEVTYRGDLRRSISETVTGSIGLAHARRTGSNWYNLVNTAPLVYGTTNSPGQEWVRAGTFPAMLTDRTRDKLKGSVDWAATEKLSVTFAAETSYDRYTPPNQIGGLRSGRNWLYSVDASYALSEKWKATAYGSLGSQAFRVEQGNNGYIANVSDRNAAFGVGLTGKPTGLLDVGGTLTYVQDVNKFGLGADPFGTTAATVAANNAQAALGLPDVTFRETRLNLFAKYAIDKRSDVRLDVIHVITTLNEWTWGGQNGLPFFTYGDNTTVLLNPNQHVTFIGARYIYKF
jgi:MtrB/PioB family decaheme-associated outer membrane protein